VAAAAFLKPPAAAACRRRLPLLDTIPTRARVGALLAAMGLLAWMAAGGRDAAAAASVASAHNASAVPSVAGAAPSPAGDFCTSDFPALYASFVDWFVDSAFVGAPAGAPPAPAPPFRRAAHAPAAGALPLAAAAAVAGDTPPQHQLPTRLPAAARLVAIGDLHGDLPKARRAFRLAGLIDDQDRWAGGSTVAVQARRGAALCQLPTNLLPSSAPTQPTTHNPTKPSTPPPNPPPKQPFKRTLLQVGDQLDRGDDEIAILYFLERLQQARACARAGRAIAGTVGGLTGPRAVSRHASLTPRPAAAAAAASPQASDDRRRRPPAARCTCSTATTKR